MKSDVSKLDESKENSNYQENDEKSIYSDACSNSFEIAQLIKKDKEKTVKNMEKKNENLIKNINQNDSTTISITDKSAQNGKGSITSFNSTQKTLYIKKAKSLKNMKVVIPTKNYLNYKYSSNNAKLLTPIEEKQRSSDNSFLPVFSAEYEKQNTNIGRKDFFLLRQSLEPKNGKSIFSPNINITQNYFNFKNNINLNIKKLVFPKEKKESESTNDKNYNIFKNTKKTQKEKNNKTKEKRNKSISSFKLKSEDNTQKRSSINSTLEIRKFLKFDKISRISEIEFHGIYKDEIDLDFLKQKLRTIPVKTYKKTSSKDKYIKTLVEIQNFYAEKSPIWVMKLSKNYEYLAIGAKNGSIKIFSFFDYNSEDFDFIYDKKNILNYFKFISEKPFLCLNKHTKDITDLSWSPFNYELLLSASVDHYVILWDISKKEGGNIIKKFNHKEIVTCLKFSPTEPNIFVTGCFDKFIRFFEIDDSIVNEEENNNMKLNESNFTINVTFNNFNNKGINKNENNNNKKDKNENKFKMTDYFNINQIITSVEFFPDGSKLAIGTHNGKILVYNLIEKINYDYCFFCRNKLGEFSSGKKITCIKFIDKNRALVTTSDSRIRLMSMNSGKMIYKYKGHQNLNSMIRCSADLVNDILICGSEDNFCYIWDIFNSNEKEKKNYKYEYFKSFARENIYCSLIAPEICYTNYIKKIYKLTNKINIISIIINATDNGRLEVILNTDEN